MTPPPAAPGRPASHAEEQRHRRDRRPGRGRAGEHRRPDGRRLVDDADEPDNAQDNGMGGYGPPVAPATLVTRYNSYKAADPARRCPSAWGRASRSTSGRGGGATRAAASS